MESKELLSVAELLKWDTDKRAILDYIEEKVLTITMASMKSFFNQRKKNEKVGSTTNVDKEACVVIGARLGSIGWTQELALEKEKMNAVSIEELTKELETEVYEAFVQRFNQVVSQVKVVFPEIDVEKLDATKVVVNEKLVDDNALGE
ncbi:hypothetical protein AHAS_Ahas01G0124800 [Arachis hypogaea]